MRRFAGNTSRDIGALTPAFFYAYHLWAMLKNYLQRFADRRRVTVVGPMLGVPFNPTAAEEPVIWVDGGVNHRPQDAGQDCVGFSVGDGDSAAEKLDQELDTDKDYSDLAFVLGCLRARFSSVVLLGFLGGRRDHELFNLGEVHHFLAAAKTPTRVRFDDSLEVYSAGEWGFEIHGVFSLMVFEPTTVKLAGACKFPLTTPTKIAPLRSLGLSNHGFGAITLTTRGPAFIFKTTL